MEFLKNLVCLEAIILVQDAEVLYAYFPFGHKNIKNPCTPGSVFITNKIVTAPSKPFLSAIGIFC